MDEFVNAVINYFENQPVLTEEQESLLSWAYRLQDK